MRTHINEVAATPIYPEAARMPSSAIWKNCPVADLANGTRDGHYYFNDFTGDYVLANNKTVAALGNGVSACTAATGGTTLGMDATAPYGVAKLNVTTDNEDVIVNVLGGLNTAGQIVFETGKKVWFEARVKCLNITDSKFGVFCGFAEEGLCATTTLIGADGALVDKDYIGFHKLEADGDKFDIVYNTAGGGGQVVHLADGITIVADTYLKLGIYCDGTSLYFYKDGVQVGTALALSAAKVPDGEEVAFYFAIMAAHADDASASIDWVRIAEQRA